MQPREYQLNGVNQLIKFIAKGYKRIVFQLPTGGGKTVCFGYFLQRYFKAFPDHIAKTLVHREKLATQATATLKAFNINNVPVLMIEGFCNKLKKGIYTNAKVIIIDETHIGNFRKVFSFFPDAIIIGFSATPISSSKKHPLKADFEQIVVCTDIKELIQIGALVPARHYQPVNQIQKSNIGKSAGDYNMKQMSNELSKTKIVDGVLKNYADIGEHKKTIIFNSLVEHSQKVNECFLQHGYGSRQLDGTMGKEEQAEIWKWFRETPDAILNSVDMATTGVDEPTIINVIPNRLTMSLTLWLQMAGRGGRTSAGKEYFNLIDPVGNISQHGKWDHKHDWYSLFHFPNKPGSGPPPMKTCPNPECMCMIYMSSTKCEHCGHLMPRELVYTDLVTELQLVPEDLVIPPNSPITLDKSLRAIAGKVKTKPIDLLEQRGVMEFAIKKLHQQSNLSISSNMAVHLAAKHL